MDYIIRRAGLSDLGALVEFTLAEAKEAEGLSLKLEKVQKGIRAALEDEGVAVYWILEDSRKEAAGHISVVKEWSNWKAGYYWWIQSLYIKPEYRGHGLMAKLIQAVRKSAKDGQALELRLYVHKSNERAIKAYRKVGFVESDYRIMRIEV